MLYRGLIVGLIATVPAMACSCGSYEPVKACQIFASTPVIFRGRVIDHNHDRTAGLRQPALYRFKVLEIFKGLSPGTKEVFVDPMSWTSCMTVFSPDVEYLVYTDKGQPATAYLADLSSPRPGWPQRQIPAVWKGLERLSVHSVGVCSPTKSVRTDDADLAYLRSLIRGGQGANGWIEGKAVQNFNWPHESADFVAVSDAGFTIVSHSGARRTATVRPNGTFEMKPVLPGTYQISAQSPILGNGVLEDSKITVPPGGCVAVRASFTTGSTISGKVLDADGKPASKIRLELGELKADGTVRVIPRTRSNSDRDGNFELPNAPVGRIVLAGNLNGAPTPSHPFDPVFAPGTQDVSAARIFAVQPGRQVTGVSVQLPKPLPFGDLFVDVKWPDGSPALGGARAVAYWNGTRAGSEWAPKETNRVKLRLALGRHYSIGADWIDAKPGKFLYVDEGRPLPLDFTRDGQVTEIRLESPHP